MKFRNALAAAGLAVVMVVGAPVVHAETTRLTLNGARPFLEPFNQMFGGLTEEEYAELTPRVGANWLPGTSAVVVDYPATAGPIWGPDAPTADQATAEGRDNLDAAIRTATADGDPVVVAGLSEGTIVIDETLTHLATDPDAPPKEDVSFVLFASPSRGVMSLPPPGIHIPFFGFTTRAIPDSQYDVSVVFGEYDGWADFPDRPWNLLADINALMGAFVVDIHTATALASQSQAVVVSTTTSPTRGGTTTTYMVPTPRLPLTEPLRRLGVPTSVTDDIDKVLRPIVDAGYSRKDDGPVREPYISQGRLVVPKPSDSSSDLSTTKKKSSSRPSLSVPKKADRAA